MLFRSSSAASSTLVDMSESGRESPDDTESLSAMVTALSLSPMLSSARGTGSIFEAPLGQHNRADDGDVPFPTPDGEGKTYEIGVHMTNAWFVPLF